MLPLKQRNLAYLGCNALAKGKEFLMATTDSPIMVSTAAGVAMIILNRPDKRNALNGELIQALVEVLNKLAADKDTYLVIIKGQGDHFCAGADIAWMQQVIATQSYDANYDDAQSLADLLFQLYSFPKPTIVLAHGATLGGGMGLIAAGDIAIAANNAVFGFPEVKIGVTPSTISPYIIKAIGERAAQYYFITGERFSADEAVRLGLIHQLTSQDELLHVGKTLAETLLKNGPHAMFAAKQLIRAVANEKINAKLSQKTAEHLAEIRSSKEAREGLQAFLEKRSPNWR